MIILYHSILPVILSFGSALNVIFVHLARSLFDYFSLLFTSFPAPAISSRGPSFRRTCSICDPFRLIRPIICDPSTYQSAGEGRPMTTHNTAPHPHPLTPRRPGGNRWAAEEWWGISRMAAQPNGHYPAGGAEMVRRSLVVSPMQCSVQMNVVKERGRGCGMNAVRIGLSFIGGRA